MPVEYGGSGGDFIYDAIVMEELAYLRAHGLMTAVHTSICMPYILTFGTEEPAEKEPDKKDCPDCAMKIPFQAKRCPYCTSELSSAATQ